MPSGRDYPEKLLRAPQWIPTIMTSLLHLYVELAEVFAYEAPLQLGGILIPQDETRIQ